MGTEGKRLEIGRVDSSGCEILAEPNDKRRRRRRKKKKKLKLFLIARDYATKHVMIRNGQLA